MQNDIVSCKRKVYLVTNTCTKVDTKVNRKNRLVNQEITYKIKIQNKTKSDVCELNNTDSAASRSNTCNATCNLNSLPDFSVGMDEYLI